MSTPPFPELTTLAAVSTEAYLQAEAYILGLLAARFPDKDFKKGTSLYWNVVVPAAASFAALRTTASAMGASLTLKGLQENVDTVDEALAAAILSNYYQTAKNGTPSAGTVVVVVSSESTYALASGTVFLSGGLQYITSSPVFVRLTSGEVQTTEDRLLTARTDGNYQFTVPVASSDVGVKTFLPLGTALTMQDPPANFVSAAAASDISGGTDTQSIKDVIAQIPPSFAAQTFGSRTNTAAMIAEAFPNTKVASIGFGDPQQQRDTHNLLQIQTGGMVDLYVATQGSVASEIKQYTGVLLDPVAKTWQIQIPAEDTPGLYAVNGVVPAGSSSASMPILVKTRGISVPTTGYLPLITTPAEAAFSAYQSYRFTFTDTLSSHVGLIAGDTKTYDVEVLSMPLVKDIQDFLIQGRMTKADNVLVRGAVPCITRISMVVRLLDADTLTDDEVLQIKTAIINRVQTIGFGYGVLSSSIIMDAVHDYLSGRSDVGATTVTLRGDIYAPSGETLVLGGQEIRIPEDPARMVSKINTVFLTDISRIDIQLTAVETP
jgi:hypothetical protein